MLNLKSSTTGIDTPIQNIQKYLYGQLKKVWNLDDNTLDGFGRAYRNTNDKGIVPEVFTEVVKVDNTQYDPIFFDKTTKSALFFFNVDDVTAFKTGTQSDKVQVIFITNLAKIKPDLNHRGDEEAIIDAQILCNTGREGFILTGTETGFKNVFRSFNGLVNQDGEVFEDRHPLFCFKINLQINFQPTEIDC